MEACRHCGGTRGYRPRGLCSKCYFSDARDLYPLHKKHWRGIGLGTAAGRKQALESVTTVAPSIHQGAATRCYYGYTAEDLEDMLKIWLPTKAAPGTEEKIRVMEERAVLGLPIFHPGDSRVSLE